MKVLRELVPVLGGRPTDNQLRLSGWKITGSRGLVNDNGSAFGNCCDFESTLHARGVVRVPTWKLSGLKANSNNERKNREQRELMA